MHMFLSLCKYYTLSKFSARNCQRSCLLEWTVGGSITSEVVLCRLLILTSAGPFTLLMCAMILPGYVCGIIVKRSAS